MVQGQWFAPGVDSADVLSIRQAVFGRGKDTLDPLSWNVLVSQDEVPVATGRIWWEDGAFRLGDIAVLSDARGRMLGDLTLRLLLFKAQSHAAREVRLASPPEVTGFFTRLGFQAENSTEGHIEMFLPGDQIELDSCKSCKKANCPRRQA